MEREGGREGGRERERKGGEGSGVEERGREERGGEGGKEEVGREMRRIGRARETFINLPSMVCHDCSIS